MKKNRSYCFIRVAMLLFVFSASCNKSTEVWKEKNIIYKDSLCNTPLDTILLFEKDSNYVKKDGYYKIFYTDNTDDYATGKIKNHKMTGLWKTYSGNLLDKEEHYNDKGELHGFVISYDRFKGKFFSVYHFVNGEQEGIQKEYHLENNTLSRVYSLHQSYYYRDNYTCYNKEGKIIYHENFGKDGTGYYKEFDNETLIREGRFVKDEPVGMHSSYELMYDDSLLTTQSFFNQKGGLYRQKIFGNLEILNSKGDSILYEYTKNKTTRTTFLKRIIIKKEVFNDTIL